MHNPDIFGKNETYIVVWDIEIKTDRLISARWPDLIKNE